MTRKLKYHEQKLLKKTNFYSWKNDNQNEYNVIERFQIQKREDYVKYRKIVGDIVKIATLISILKENDSFKEEMTQKLILKLYNYGLLESKNTLEACTKMSVSAFCRRRLAVVVTNMRMAESIKLSTTLIEQGHVCIGSVTVTDPSFHISRGQEDLITWTTGSKIRINIERYNNAVDDYENM